MANVKITELTALTNPASSDVLPIVDVGADTTKKVTIADLLENAGDGSAANPAFSFDNDKNTGIYRPGADQLAISTGATGRLFIDSAGNVGVGVSSPNVKLDISAFGSGYFPAIELTNSGGSGSTIRSKRGLSLEADYDNNSGNTESQIIFKTDSFQRMVIDEGGNVGISETSPQDRLHIKDTASSTSLRVTTNRSGSTYGNSCIVFDSPRSNSSDGGHHDGRGMISCLGNSSGNNGIVWLSAGSASLHPTESDTDLKANQCGLRLESNGSLELWVSDNKRFAIDSSGNVGIGASTVRDKTHIYGGGQTTANITDSGTRDCFLRLSQSGSSAGTGGGILFASEQSDNANSVGFAAIKGLLTNGTNNTKGNLAFSVRNSTTDTSLQEAMRLDSTGRLLVGTSTALDTEAILPNIQSAAAGNTAGFGAFRFSNDAPGPIFHFFKSRGTAVGTNTVVQSGDTLGEIRFTGADGTNELLGARIRAFVDNTPGTNDMPGRLVFSTTADGASSPTERMRISSNGVVSLNTGGGDVSVGSGTTDGTTIYHPSNPTKGAIQTSTNGGPAMYLRRRSSDGDIIDFRRDTTSVGSISVTTTATAYNTSSDYRLKENVVDIADGIARVKQLAPKRFNFIANADTTVDGFLAHEAQTVVPEAVTGTHDEVDDDGNAVMQGIDQSKLVPLLTAALQEAIAKIETLEQRLTDAGL